MGRLIVEGTAAIVGAIAHMLRQSAAQGFELIHALLLLVHQLIERFDQIFLMRQFDFNLDKTVFSIHDTLPGGKNCILLPGDAVCPGRREQGFDARQSFFR